MIFYLGIHDVHLLPRITVPTFVSVVRLTRRNRKTLPRPAAPWALDSGGFSELAKHGRWTVSAEQYAETVSRIDAAMPGRQWAAPQDWMCEEFMLDRTGKTVAEHQHLTIENFLELRGLAVPNVVPVLQGQSPDDYLDHREQYTAAGVDLETEPLVGVGSVCRRQALDEAADIFRALHPLSLHGFGIKGAGIRAYGDLLTSADSMAWSYRGRHVRPCPHRGTASCANCLDHALEWRDRALSA